MAEPDVESTGRAGRHLRGPATTGGRKIGSPGGSRISRPYGVLLGALPGMIIRPPIASPHLVSRAKLQLTTLLTQ